MTVTNYSSSVTLNSRNNFNNPIQIQNIFTQIQAFRPDFRKYHIEICNIPHLLKEWNILYEINTIRGINKKNHSIKDYRTFYPI